LNDDYQQRLKDFADLWAKSKDDKSKRKISQDGPGENRLVELQQQLVELEQSYDDMAAKKDAVISSTRKELDTVSKKLMETEQLFLLTIDKENDIIFKVRSNQLTNFFGKNVFVRDYCL
jgi:DNA repair protein RadC